MTTIVTRAGKGSPLTNNEVDTNFTNLNSAKIETLTSTDASVTITGTGDSRNLSVPVNPAVVSGPASSTDNAITRFDGTTGKLIQNSTVTLDDNGNVINANSLGLDTTPATVPTTVGTMSWDDGDGVPTVALKGGNVNLQVGTQEYARVYNDSGTTLTRGQVVYISGSQGNRVAVKLARADVEATSFGTLGLVAETMANGAEGFVIVSGALYKLNTSALVAGATVYLSPTTAGAITTTKPQAPQQLVVLGWVERVDATVGSIYVKIDNGYELDELHDVRITTPISGNVLIYDATTSPIGVWKNASITAGTGVSVTNGAGSVTIANTGVTSITGTASQVTASASTGGVTLSLPATINVNTSGNAANVTGTVAIANGGTGATTAAAARTNLGGTTVGQNVFTLTNPSAVTFPRFNADNTVSALDAATFRTAIGAGTGNGTVTSVTGTAPVSSSGGATPAISLASGYGDTQNPYASKTANNFLAAPNGTAGVPTFRAIVAADIPTLNQNTTGTASNVTGTVAIANGGTGATNAATALTNLGAYPSSNPNGYTSNTGTVTSITAGTGLSGGTITTSGTIALANTAVTPGSYTATNITVDAQGRITAASNGSAGATITDDTTTNATRYILFDDVTSGTLTTVNTSSTKLTYNPSTGTLTVSGDVVSGSDESLKTNWRPLADSFVSDLAKVKNGVYDRIDLTATQVGVSAQSLQAVLPEAVTLGQDDKLAVAYGHAALAACVELAKEIVKLKAELESLKGK